MTKEIDFNGKKLALETGELAMQANMSVLARYGDSFVLATVTTAEPNPDVDYWMYNVVYEERLYAAGKIKGSRFIKREGRASDEAILSGRLIDRSIRPLFDSRMRRDIQIVVTVLSYDEENDPDFSSPIA